MSAPDSRPALPIHLPFDSISPSFSKNSPCVFQVWDIISHRWVRCHAGVIVRLHCNIEDIVEVISDEEEQVNGE